jgi:hypothetical protein
MQSLGRDPTGPPAVFNDRMSDDELPFYAPNTMHDQ